MIIFSFGVKRTENKAEVLHPKSPLHFVCVCVCEYPDGTSSFPVQLTMCLGTGHYVCVNGTASN